MESNMEYTELISYNQFIKDRENFIKSGTKSGSEFNLFDVPNYTFFKILFYFQNGDSENDNGISGGLLAPTWNINNINGAYYNYPSAWSYLKMNNEEERAEKLEQFVNLLSNISSKSPWMFSSISGLQEALERNIYKTLTIEEDRKKISIKCQKDSMDNRIGTLLDLYRDVTWSWETKREVIPANLRKFDMAIYIFSTPYVNLHKNAGLFSGSYNTSYKYFELHNCEIDYNSSKSGYGDLNNDEGNEWEYTIDIMFDNIYEQRYNEFMMRTIGDIIKWDTIINESHAQTDSESHLDELNKRVNAYKNGGFIDTAIDELIGAGKQVLSNKVKSAILGNLYTASLPTIYSQIRGAAQGHILSTASALDDYAEHLNRGGSKINKNLGNLFKGNSVAKNI